MHVDRADQKACLAAGPPIGAGVEREHHHEGESGSRVPYDVEVVLLLLCVA
jgi:hypothetical protein